MARGVKQRFLQLVRCWKIEIISFAVLHKSALKLETCYALVSYCKKGPDPCTPELIEVKSDYLS